MQRSGIARGASRSGPLLPGLLPGAVGAADDDTRGLELHLHQLLGGFALQQAALGGGGVNLGLHLRHGVADLHQVLQAALHILLAQQFAQAVAVFAA